MAPQIPPVPAFDLVVFGGTGDLALRKLLPALYLRHHAGQILPESRIIAAARQPSSDAAYRAAVEEALAEHVPAEARDKDAVTSFLSCLSFVGLDALSSAGWQDLAWVLGTAKDRVRVFYLAVAPTLIAPICQRLGSEGLVTPTTRVVVEKPIGHDLTSAMAIGDAVGAVFAETQIFRIDHYLGKGMVQNLMTLRFANALFEPLWNAARIDHVEITVAETIGVEQRGAYYDATGALRDVVQNHVLQLLCLIAIEPPNAINADAVRDEKLKVLKSLVPIDGSNAANVTVRGQYSAGADAGASSPAAYAGEIGHATTTETFAAIKAEIGNWRWAGVPFYLRAGKRLAARVSEIVIAFRPIPYSIFLPTSGAVHPNRLVLRVQPDEGVKLWLMARDPGPTMHLTCVPLQVSLATAFHETIPDAYERLLMDVVRGDQTLFMRRDEVEAAWRWIDPIIAAWRASADAPEPYAPGDWGPAGATALVERDGRKWHDPTPT